MNLVWQDHESQRAVPTLALTHPSNTAPSKHTAVHPCPHSHHRQYLQEADVDAEVQALLTNVKHIKDTDEGVATVLLISAQDEIEHLRRQLTRYQTSGHHLPHTPVLSHDPPTLLAPHSPRPLVHVHLDCTTSNDPDCPVQLSVTPCTPRTSLDAPAASVRMHAEQVQSLVNRLQTISNDLISLKPSIMAAKLSNSGSTSAAAATPTAAGAPGATAVTPGTPGSRASPQARTPRQTMAPASPRVSSEPPPAGVALPRIRTATSASAAELGSVGSTHAPSTPGAHAPSLHARACEPQDLRPMVVRNWSYAACMRCMRLQAVLYWLLC